MPQQVQELAAKPGDTVRSPEPTCGRRELTSICAVAQERLNAHVCMFPHTHTMNKK